MGDGGEGRTWSARGSWSTFIRLCVCARAREFLRGSDAGVRVSEKERDACGGERASARVSGACQSAQTVLL